MWGLKCHFELSGSNELSGVEITRVDCIKHYHVLFALTK